MHDGNHGFGRAVMRAARAVDNGSGNRDEREDHECARHVLSFGNQYFTNSLVIDSPNTLLLPSIPVDFRERRWRPSTASSSKTSSNSALSRAPFSTKRRVLAAAHRLGQLECLCWCQSYRPLSVLDFVPKAHCKPIGKKNNHSSQGLLIEFSIFC